MLPEEIHKTRQIFGDISVTSKRIIFRTTGSMSLKKLTTALIDLSGTIHIDNSAIQGSIEALKRLRSSSVKIKFVTNTTKESKATLHQRLLKIGFEIDEAEIFTSLTAARSLVEKTAARPFLMLSDDALNDFSGISTDDPDTVVVGLAPNSFSYENLNKAFRLVIDGAPLVAINKARYFMRADGLALGPGPFVEGLEYAAGVTATVVGKPERTFFMEALELLESEPGEAVMIGDDAGSDIDGAQIMGMRGILVKTGKYRPSDESKISPAPSYVVDDFGAAVDLILNELTK